MSSYRERLWPSIWIYLATALVIPASILVLAPVNIVAGVVAAGVLFVGLAGIFIVLAPVIEVKDGMLIAGKARIPVEMLGTP